jgi:Rrf2 family protein
MPVSGNTRFAVSLHILAYLAYRSGGAVPSAEIAASVATHPVVIRRLLAVLTKSGLVCARKGAAGGFALASPPANISLLAVYRAVEPQPTRGVDRLEPNLSCPVGAKISGILHDIFGRAQAGMEAELGRLSLAEVEQQLRPVCPEKRRSGAS